MAQQTVALRGIPVIWAEDLRRLDASFPPNTAQLLAQALAPNTLRNYNAMFARFRAFCESSRLSDWRMATPGTVFRFLESITRSVTRPRATLDVALAALGHAFRFASASPLSNPALSLLRSALQRSRTSRPLARTTPLPVEPIVQLFRKWPPNELLTLQQLRDKTLALWMIALIMRPSDAASVDADWVDISPDGSSAVVSLLAFKNDYQRDGARIELSAASDIRICPLAAFCELRSRLYGSSVPQRAPLFTSLGDTKSRLSPSAISTICRDICSKAGLPSGAFSGRNFRAGGATRGLQAKIPLDVVMHVGRWRSSSTVQRHYVSRFKDFNVTDAILGTQESPTSRFSASPGGDSADTSLEMASEEERAEAQHK